MLKPSTIISFHQALVKRRNRRFGCRHIAQQLSYIFGIDIDKDIVRRDLATHYRPMPGSQGPSWLSFLGHTRDSLWSVDLFRCESLLLKTHWVMLVMDQFSRRTIGLAVHAATVDGPTVCRMFNEILSRANALPRSLSSDHDPLFKFRQWRANLRILDVTELKTVPYVRLSHPFVERLIGSVRRELLDHVLFWTARDLQRKLQQFQKYFNRDRVHSSLAGLTPNSKAENSHAPIANLGDYRWQSHCRGLYQLPTAA